MKRFVLERLEDVSGVSGTGIIGEGVKVEIPNHPMPIALFWTGDKPTTSFYSSMEQLLEIHGHAGKSVIYWIDDPDFATGDHCHTCHGFENYCVDHGDTCPKCLRES